MPLPDDMYPKRVTRPRTRDYDIYIQGGDELDQRMRKTSIFCDFASHYSEVGLAVSRTRECYLMDEGGSEELCDDSRFWLL